jgi:hypothetical protein
MNNNSIQSKISNLHAIIMKKQHNAYLQVGYFFLIICAMSLIISSICTDISKTLFVYFSKLNLVDSAYNSITTSDNNDYDTTSILNDNQLNKIEESIMIQHAKQKNFYKDNIEWKKKHNIPNQKIEGQIDLGILEEKNDNYNYNKSNNGDSFWKMLLMPPKYHDLVQHNAKPYYKFMKDE